MFLNDTNFNNNIDFLTDSKRGGIWCGFLAANVTRRFPSSFYIFLVLTPIRLWDLPTNQQDISVYICNTICKIILYFRSNTKYTLHMIHQIIQNLFLLSITLFHLEMLFVYTITTYCKSFKKICLLRRPKYLLRRPSAIIKNIREKSPTVRTYCVFTELNKMK